MGDVKKLRKKYETPRHPWNATRIKLERNILRKYGVVNKREIWRMESVLKSFKDQAKSLLTRTDAQANKERQQMIDRMIRLGLVQKGAGVDDILGLQLRDVMDRRLQTIVLKNRLARSIKHARQLITHEHIIVGDKKVTSPSYLVTAGEEPRVAYAPDSPYQSESHPEAFDEETAQRRLLRQRARAERKGHEFDEIVMFDNIEDPDEVKKDDFDASVADLRDDGDDKKESEKSKKDDKKGKPKSKKEEKSEEKKESGSTEKPKQSEKSGSKQSKDDKKPEKKDETTDKGPAKDTSKETAPEESGKGKESESSKTSGKGSEKSSSTDSKDDKKDDSEGTGDTAKDSDDKKGASGKSSKSSSSESGKKSGDKKDSSSKKDSKGD